MVKVATLKGGEFLIKETDPQSVFIPEDMTEEQQMVLEMCRDFIKNEVLPVPQKIEIIVSLLDKAAELGL